MHSALVDLPPRNTGEVETMSEKERAIQAIEAIPEDTTAIDIVRKLSFITGVEEARGEGMTSAEAEAQSSAAG